MNITPNNVTQPKSAKLLGEEPSPLMVLTHAVRKYSLTLVLVTLPVFVGVTFYTLGQTKIYRASMTIRIDPKPPTPLGNAVQTVVDMGSAKYWNNQEYYETEFEILRSMNVALETVSRLGLHRDLSFLANQPSDAVLDGTAVTPEVAAEKLRKRLTVDPVKETRLTEVSLLDADPIRAQRVLTELVNVYIDQHLNYVQDSTTDAVDWLNDQAGKLKVELESTETSVNNYKTKNNILSVSVDDQTSMLREEMLQLNEALTRVRTHHQHLTSRLALLKGFNPENPANLPTDELLKSGPLQQHRDLYIQANSELQALLGSGRGNNHPSVLAAQASLGVLKKAIHDEVANIVAALRHDVTASRQEKQGLAGLFNTAKQRALDLNTLSIDYNRLERDRDNTEKLYSLVLDRAKKSDLTRMMRVNNIRVSERAGVPKLPVFPRVPLNLAFGLFAGIVLGIAVAFGREMLDRTIKTPEQLETDFGLPTLGLLPEIDAKNQPDSPQRKRRRHKDPAEKLSPELIVHSDPTSGVAEAARAIRTNIMLSAPDKQFKTILVTSAGPREGKTTVACCVAVAMAQAGQRVCLLDCDMRRPRLHKVFGKLNDRGLTSLMLDRSVFDDLPKTTPVDNLDVIPAGPIPPNPAELIHSENFSEVLQMLGEKYDRLIIDSPPIAPVTDPTILSTKVDGTILVVRAFQTTRDLVRRARNTLASVQGPLIGAVLNAVDLHGKGYAYYKSHHYYYYKQEGYGPEESQDDAA
ncbi:MAG: polysaccharide biosynthesis tyrosine autokinase [Polyangiaceae bacterium]|nr:polysaccharide biosynthesis tyrosine autokinase [Polyangiaceae bacterium]